MVKKGGLTAELEELCNACNKHTDDWEKRQAAVLDMQELVQRYPAAAFTGEVWRTLNKTLKYTIQDLRSNLVRETCKLLTIMSEISGDSMKLLMRDIFGAMLHLVGGTNSTIQEYVDDCVKSVIHNTRFPKQIKEMVFEARDSHSARLREAVASYLTLMLEVWPASVLDREVEHLQSGITMLVQDASVKAREEARHAYTLFQAHWSTRADRILQKVDQRTAKLLQNGPPKPGHASGASASSLEGRGHRQSMLVRPQAGRRQSSQGEDHSRSQPTRRQSQGGDRGSQTPRSTRSRGHSPRTFSECGDCGVEVGYNVLVRAHGEMTRGVVRFVGEAHFAAGMWVGVELEASRGKNDGSVGGVSYFSCRDNFGMFVRPDAVEREEDELIEEDEEAARRRTEARELLDAHRKYAQQLMSTLQEEVQVIPAMDAVLKSPKPLDEGQVASYRELLGSVLGARDSLAAALREQLGVGQQGGG
ncbi:unnamed protein product [Chrysoparadoxa australica]